jgi:AraC-like DNA-binding protein
MAPEREEQTPVIPSTFTTQSLRPLDQLQAWQEWFSPVFDISPTEQVGDEFHAQNTVWNLGDLLISRVSAPSVRVVRTKANLANAPIDHWVLTCCQQGATAVQTPRGEFNAAAGVPFLWSLGEKFESKRTRVDRIQILMSREAFHSLAPLLDASRGSALETHWGGLLGDYIMAVERWLPSMKISDASKLSAAVRNMVAACVAPSAEHTNMVREEIESSLLERARRAVQAHLRSPQLQPASLCRTLGISRSQLYRLFERTGGVVRYIQRQRLLGACAELSDPANERTIAAVAGDFCFEDASSFGRAFRREFGYSASDVRSAARAGILLVAARRAEMEAEAVHFADLFEAS